MGSSKMAASTAIVRSSRQLLQLQSARRILLCNFSASKILSDKVTHTGQKFDEQDWKRIRFIDREKLVNKNVAFDLIAEEPPIEVDARIVSCNGGGGALGHPKVFINLDK